MRGKLAFPANLPWPATYDEGIAAAIKAAFAGNATPGQMQDAMKWIVNGAGMFGQCAFVAGQPDLSDNLSGRQAVALQIIFLRDTPLKVLLQKEPT